MQRIQSNACYRWLYSAVLFGGVTGACAAAPAPDWPGWGGPQTGNQRNAIAETAISAANVASLAVRWATPLGGNVSATPTVQGRLLYVTDDAGGITCIDIAGGGIVWSHKVADFTGNGGSVSRSSPAIAGKLVVIADRHSGSVMALDRMTGSLAWMTVVETHPYVVLTASPVIYGSRVYVGASNNEEYWVTQLGNYTPSFRGSVSALDLASGQVLWKTYMVPGGYTGGSVWGSGFPVSAASHSLYVATGNNTSVPPGVDRCLQARGGRAGRLACMDAANFVDSVVSLDLATGAVNWSQRLQGSDLYTSNCSTTSPAQPCPSPAGPDYDFGSAPNLFSASIGGQARALVGAGQKSGRYWALDEASGAIVWSGLPAQGALRGGILWGSALDGGHVFVAENNAGHATTKLGPPWNATTNGASWAALDPATGHTLWQVAAGSDPNNPVGAEGALSTANGVVFAEDTAGNMLALDAASGHTLWRYATGYSVTSGPAIVGGVVYWGTGDAAGSPANKLIAFAPRG